MPVQTARNVCKGWATALPVSPQATNSPQKITTRLAMCWLHSMFTIVHFPLSVCRHLCFTFSIRSFTLVVTIHCSCLPFTVISASAVRCTWVKLCVVDTETYSLREQLLRLFTLMGVCGLANVPLPRLGLAIIGQIWLSSLVPGEYFVRQ